MAEGKSRPVGDRNMSFACQPNWSCLLCKLANARGCEYAGNRYLKGEGVTADPAKGKQLLQRACEHGTKSACRSDGATPAPAAGKP
jgi:TPR repeat protein